MGYLNGYHQVSPCLVVMLLALNLMDYAPVELYLARTVQAKERYVVGLTLGSNRFDPFHQLVSGTRPIKVVDHYHPFHLFPWEGLPAEG